MNTLRSHPLFLHSRPWGNISTTGDDALEEREREISIKCYLPTSITLLYTIKLPFILPASKRERILPGGEGYKASHSPLSLTTHSTCYLLSKNPLFFITNKITPLVKLLVHLLLHFLSTTPQKSFFLFIAIKPINNRALSLQSIMSHDD